MVLHKVPDTLSRMFEDEDSTEICAVEVINDLWYNQGVKDVINQPHKYHGWKVVKELLYYFRFNPLIVFIFENQKSWDLVVPSEKRAQVLQVVHDERQAGHLGIEK